MHYLKDATEIDAAARKEGVLTCADDTHVTIGAAESLARAGGFDGGDMVQPFIANCEHG